MLKPILALAALCAVAPASAQQPPAPAPTFSPQPWREDLAVMREAMHTKYANLP